MNLDRLLEIEARQEFEDVNAIRQSRIHSFMDEWIVTALLGRGSFGNVYKIVKPQPGIKNQECALKICKVLTPADAELISQEIKMQMELSGHPNAVQIEDYALISREPPKVSYLLIRMELLKPLPEDGLSEREAIRMGIDICSVLEKCASLEPKLIHCDIKPANILMTDDGRYKLGDFGTAKTLQATMTYTGNRGTPLYMAPEVASYTGYDSRCDIFSLGYTMLTMLNKGVHPYLNNGERTDILRAMYDSRKLPQIKGVSSGLMKILRKMCEPGLGARYSRPSEVRRDLELFVRRKEEADRLAKLEAERQAEIARKKAKAEREKSIRVARQTVEKRQNELDAAMTALDDAELKDRLSARSRVKQAEAALNRAVRTQQHVLGGMSYELALKAVRDEDIAAAQQKRLDFLKANQKTITAAAACIALIIIGLSSFVVIFTNTDWTALPSSGAASTDNSAIPSGGSKNYEPSPDIGSPSSPEPSNDASEEITLDNGLVLRLMPSYSYTNQSPYAVYKYTVSGYTGNKAELVIPTEYQGIPITQIDYYAFMDCSTLVSITIPDSVTSIGLGAFHSCTSLKSIELPDSITSIGHSAFYGCTSLKNIEIPNSVTVIDDYAFAGCSSLISIKLPDNLARFTPYILSSCTSLENVYISEDNPYYTVYDGAVLSKDMHTLLFVPAKKASDYTIPPLVSSIGEAAFAYCDSIKTIEIPDTVTYIHSSAFSHCTSLESVTLPDSILSILDFTFSECTSLKSIEIPDSVTSIGFSAFLGCSSLESITLHNSLTSIGNYAFFECSALRSIEIPDSVSSIGSGTFAGCTILTTVTLPDSIDRLQYRLFDNCLSLKKITIPDSVTFIDNTAFSNCSSLTVTAPHEASYYGDNLSGYDKWVIR